jgi:hypothetical protein
MTAAHRDPWDRYVPYVIAVSAIAALILVLGLRFIPTQSVGADQLAFEGKT